MTEKDKIAKQEEFAKKVTDFCDQLEKEGFFNEEFGCKSLFIASTDSMIHTMCVGDGPGLAGMVAQFMAEDENQARVIDIAYNSFCEWLERMGKDKTIDDSVKGLLSHYGKVKAETFS